MNIKEQLKFIQTLSGQTQEQLARSLGVTFVAFNRWINGKAQPRPKAKKRIQNLYYGFTEQKEVPENLNEAKKLVVSTKRKKNSSVLKTILNNSDIKDQFLLSLTYNSNSIEGSSLSQGDTAAILFENAALPNKSLTEQLEAKNHQAALNYLFGYVLSGKKLGENFILKLHAILLNSIREDAGLYRQHGVRIVGAFVPTANFLKVPIQMTELVKDLNKKNLDNIEQAAVIHTRFEKIHPFADGNGRVGRLLMHAMLLKDNLPPAVINKKKRGLYLGFLNKAQRKNDSNNLIEFIYEAVLEGYRILERR